MRNKEQTYYLSMSGVGIVNVRREMAKIHQDAFVILCKQISSVLISYISLQDHWLYIT